ncbi:hypothetical protein NBRC116592_02170 [Colwellia sp. KU-HH00111]|uniref:hypothetical protein n=1 Tax=Colwellia sp. KU-HH00111 TaxID=3127652 RepID=UPI0031025933
MKKILFALTLLSLSSNLAFSEEAETELMEASADYVLNLMELCKGDAIEDEVGAQDLKQYLLTCINDELAVAYYKPISVLPE